MTDDDALKILSGAGWYDQPSADDARPLWDPKNGDNLRPHLNAFEIAPGEPFVTLEGSFSREQLLALLHFHPVPESISPVELEQRLHAAKIPVDRRLRQLHDLARQIEVRLVPDLVTESDRVLWTSSVQLLNEIHAELSAAIQPQEVQHARCR